MAKQTLAEWKARTTTIELNNGFEVEIKPYDVTVLLDDEGNNPNPLIETIQKAIQEFQQSQEAEKLVDAAGKVVDKIPAVRKRLNDLLVQVIHHPPILEAGNKDGISINALTLQEKLEIYSEMFGGTAANNAAKRFLGQQNSSVVSASEGGEVREVPIGVDEDKSSDTVV